MSLYNANGQITLTPVVGSSITGLSAADGSYNVVLTTENTTIKGLHHPCGAYWGTVSSTQTFYAPDGSMNITSNGDGTYSPTVSNAGFFNTSFGVNMSGPEFAPIAGQTFPSTADWTYLASKGVTFVRLPLAWESLQPTLSAALDPTYLASVKASIAAAKAKGINTIVDLHNFAQYGKAGQWNSSITYAGNGGVVSANVQVLGDGVLTTTVLADVWTRLATALVGTSGLIGYEIMNEPVNVIWPNIVRGPGYLNTVSSPNWFMINPASGNDMVAQAIGSNPLGAGYNPAWRMTNGSSAPGFSGLDQFVTGFTAVPYTYSFWAKAVVGTIPLQVSVNGTAGSAINATTSWQRFSGTVTPAAGSGNFQVLINSATPGLQVDFANFQLELGSSATTYQPNPMQIYNQAAITAIRAIDAVTPVHIDGTFFNSSVTWVLNSGDAPALTGGPLVFHAHQYFDGPDGTGNGGVYGGTFTSYGRTTNGAGDVQSFLNWVVANGVTGFLGEFGIPNSVTDNNAAWFPTQLSAIQAARVAGVKGTQWFYGANGIQSGNNLNIAAVNDPRLLQMLSIK